MLLIGIYSERSSWRGLRGQPGGGGGREGGRELSFADRGGRREVEVVDDVDRAAGHL